MASDVKLSDGEVASILESIASDLRESEAKEGSAGPSSDVDRTASNLRSDLTSLLMLDNEVVVRDTTLQSDGRLTFGRENENVEGVALFIPEDATSEDF